MLEVVIFGFFVVVAGQFHSNTREHPKAQSQELTVAWQRSLQVLYGTSLLILLRNCVRVAEYCQGHDDWISEHEAMLFVFDALPIFAVLVILLIWHPAILLSQGQQLERIPTEQDVSLGQQPGQAAEMRWCKEAVPLKVVRRS